MRTAEMAIIIGNMALIGAILTTNQVYFFLMTLYSLSCFFIAMYYELKAIRTLRHLRMIGMINRIKREVKNGTKHKRR